MGIQTGNVGREHNEGIWEGNTNMAYGKEIQIGIWEKNTERGYGKEIQTGVMGREYK